MVDEPQDRDLVALFFTMARGQKIKGFRTHNEIIIDA
jgi:hypothetical protein